MGRLLLSFSLLSVALLTPGVRPAEAQRMPPDYRGVNVRVSGIFVTPVGGAPFSATVDIVSRQVLPDGEENVRTTVAHVARDSAGRIYNERRAMVAPPLSGEPALLSSHIFDPATSLNTFLDPSTHLAHQSSFTPRQPAAGEAPELGRHDGGELTAETDLGAQKIGSTELHGTRKVWTVPAATSGTGKAVTITDEYWYAASLSIYLILKHEDPRTGEQIVAVQNVTEREPDPATFQVPARYRVVDETPNP